MQNITQLEFYFGDELDNVGTQRLCTAIAQGYLAELVELYVGYTDEKERQALAPALEEHCPKLREVCIEGME
jgi:hypothetical protein